MANIVHDCTSDVWSVAPSSNPEDEEYFTDEADALEGAYDWSIKECGQPMIICKNGKRMLEIIA
jgi:hypothetical protein